MNYQVFAGIDQSKRSFDLCLVFPGSAHQNQHRKFQNNKEGIKQMVQWVESVASCKITKVLFCVENTGLYCWPLCLHLSAFKAKLWMESALRIKLSSGLKRGKSDPADAKDIALYAMRYHSQAVLFKMPHKSILMLKQLLAFRERLVKQKKALKCAAGDLNDMNADISGLICVHSNEVIVVLEEKIKFCDDEMLKIVHSKKELKTQFELICSVHGVGKQTALFIIIYTQGFTLFTNPRKFACYCGVAPFEFTSGSSVRGRTRVSHLANKKLKALLTMCALNTIKKTNELKDYYDRKVAEGKNPMLVINAIRNKLIGRIFAVVHRGTAYQFEPIAALSNIKK